MRDRQAAGTSSYAERRCVECGHRWGMHYRTNDPQPLTLYGCSVRTEADRRGEHCPCSRYLTARDILAALNRLPPAAGAGRERS